MKVPGPFFELNEMPSKVGRGAPDFVWHFFIIDARKPNIFAKCSAAQHRLNHQCQSSVTGKHPTARFDTWKEKRLLLIIPAYEKARMIRNSFANHPGF